MCEKKSEMLQLFPAYLKGEDLFGLTVSAVARIAESLPGVEACENYTFRYGRNPLMELPLAVNPTGCARSEPKMSAHVKRPHTLNSTSTSKSFQSTVTGELNAPYSKQFVHSKSSQYRRMKTEWKSNVYLARSRIQGLGLYAARDIENTLWSSSTLEQLFEMRLQTGRRSFMSLRTGVCTCSAWTMTT